MQGKLFNTLGLKIASLLALPYQPAIVLYLIQDKLHPKSDHISNK